MRLRLQHHRFHLPFARPVRTAHGPWSQREGLWLRLTDESGTEGFGEMSEVPGFTRETADTWLERVYQLGDYTTPETLREAFPSGPAAFAATCALAPFFPQERQTVRKKYLPLSALLPAGRACLERAGALADLGFRTFKWKVGVEPVRDEWGILDDLLGLLPAGSKLRLDANGAWDVKTAGQWLGRASERPIEFVEQPLAAGSRGLEDRLLGLAGDYPTSLALDESLVTEGDVAHWLDVGWPGYYVVKPALMGDPEGYLPSLAKAGAKVVFSSSLETRLGARAALEVAFEYPGETPAAGFGVWPLYQNSDYDGPFAAPFLRLEDVDCLKPEAVWNAKS